ncbi:hypothetical protein ACFV90_36880 [Streptomyces sp. NPDC059904]|uniref:hypothetical protein n=1 Tax=Streptomyces sp. NPDC059904 TaxID=3346996 RepID=UPI003656B907
MIDRPERCTITPLTVRFLACYRGESRSAVLERAMRMLTNADGHLLPNGTIKNERARRRL